MKQRRSLQHERFFDWDLRKHQTLEQDHRSVSERGPFLFVSGQTVSELEQKIQMIFFKAICEYHAGTMSICIS